MSFYAAPYKSLPLVLRKTKETLDLNRNLTTKYSDKLTHGSYDSSFEFQISNAEGFSFSFLQMDAPSPLLFFQKAVCFGLLWGFFGVSFFMGT